MEVKSLALWLGSVNDWCKQHDHWIILIDGRCGSGKSTLAKAMVESCNGYCIHMDDYYLPFDKRNRQADFPGNHMDYKRLQDQVIDPFKYTGHFTSIPYDAHHDRYGESTLVHGNGLIIEGSYSMHPHLIYPEYCLKVFVTIDPLLQKKRIIERGGLECWPGFENKWIPFEERYFKIYSIAKMSDEEITFDDSMITTQ